MRGRMMHKPKSSCVSQVLVVAACLLYFAPSRASEDSIEDVISKLLGVTGSVVVECPTEILNTKEMDQLKPTCATTEYDFDSFRTIWDMELMRLSLDREDVGQASPWKRDSDGIFVGSFKAGGTVRTVLFRQQRIVIVSRGSGVKMSADSDEAPDCSRWHIQGVRPGMTESQAVSAFGSRLQREGTPKNKKSRYVARYIPEDLFKNLSVIFYDGRATNIQLQLGPEDANASALLDALTERWGQSAGTKPTVVDGHAGRITSWYDSPCGIAALLITWNNRRTPMARVLVATETPTQSAEERNEASKVIFGDD